MPLKPFFAYRSFRRELETVRRFYETGVRQFCVFPANTTNSLGQPYVEYPPNWIFFDTIMNTDTALPKWRVVSGSRRTVLK